MSGWTSMMDIIWACVIGAALGWLIYEVRFQNRKLATRPVVSRLPYVISGLVLGLLAIVVASRSGWTPPEWDWILVALMGGTVGVGELLSRYRDAPIKAILSPPAIAYVFLNSAAAIFALVLGRHFEFLSPQREPIAWAQVLTAGLGAMVVLRSSVFQIRVGDGKDRQDVPVGPSSFLQSLLDAADRAVDRLRAQERAWAVASMMQNVSSAKALDLLPPYLSALMQNLNPEAEANFEEKVKELREGPGGVDLKAHRLGLIAMNYMGEGVVRAAVDSLPLRLLRAAAETSEAASEAIHVAREAMTGTEVAAAAAAKVVDASRASETSPVVEKAAKEAQELAIAANDAAARAVTQADKVADRADIAEIMAKKLERSVVPQLPNTPGIETDTPNQGGNNDMNGIHEKPDDTRPDGNSSRTPKPEH